MDGVVVGIVGIDFVGGCIGVFVLVDDVVLMDGCIGGIEVDILGMKGLMLVFSGCFEEDNGYKY